MQQRKLTKIWENARFTAAVKLSDSLDHTDTDQEAVLYHEWNRAMERIIRKDCGRRAHEVLAEWRELPKDSRIKGMADDENSYLHFKTLIVFALTELYTRVLATPRLN